MIESLLEQELALSERIVRDGHEIVPRFRILAPDGGHMMMVQLPDDVRARIERLQVVKSFMIWKAAHGYLHAAELVEPDAIVALAVTRDVVSGALRRIARRPLLFAAPEAFGRESVGDEFIDLLPQKSVTLGLDELGFIRDTFEQGSVPGIRWVEPGGGV